MKTQKTRIVLKGTPCSQNGRVFYQFTLPSRLAKCIQFDIHDTKTGKGYNRDDDLEGRGEKFCQYMDRVDAICPNPLILNSRDNSVSIQDNLNGTVDIIMDDQSVLFTPEGQGRTIGYRKLEEKGKSMGIPVVVTKTSKEHEIAICQTVDEKRKKMKSNFIYNLNCQTVINQLKDGKRLCDISDKKSLYSAISYNVLRLLDNDKTSIFYKKFILPNKKKQSAGVRRNKIYNDMQYESIDYSTVNMGSHMHGTNLAAFVRDYAEQNPQKLKDKSINKISNEIMKVLNDFWNAMEEVNPIIFEATSPIYDKKEKNKETKILRKGYHTITRNGSFVMYHVLRLMFNQDKFSKKMFKEHMKNSKTILDTSYWEAKKGQTYGLEISQSNTWKIEANKICSEMNLI